MMKCEEIEILLVDYLDNSLDENTKNIVDNHLSTCERCLDSFNESQKILKVISGSKPSGPDASLRSNFYHMLNGEIRKSREYTTVNIEPNSGGRYRRIFLAAAGFALLVAGTFIGLLISNLRSEPVSAERIEMLQSQVDEIKKNAMFSMLKEESSSYRLQGISYAGEMGKADDSVINALIRVLNTDRSVNVRLAAAFSLSKFTDNRTVCDSLVASLPRQTEPILQITLINVLTEIKERSALKPIQQIIDNGGTMNEVRKVAEKGARELIL